jgi:cation diffusion facilitator CzcD-associated flavoprotein CzcO
MSESNTNVDVVIVGAGFAGMYQLVRMRRAGFSAVVLETADDVGGTWYWNRYPGARCDILTVDYSYSWDPELQEQWTWSERYATQPEILRYAQFVADKHDLRRDIRFTTRVESAEWNDDTRRWTIHTDTGDDVLASLAPSDLVELPLAEVERRIDAALDDVERRLSELSTS